MTLLAQGAMKNESKRTYVRKKTLQLGLLVFASFVLFLLHIRTRKSNQCLARGEKFHLFIGNDLKTLRSIEDANWEGVSAWPLANPVLTKRIVTSYDTISKPHLIVHQEDLYTLFESTSCSRGKKGIGVAQSRDEGRSWTLAGVAMERDVNAMAHSPSICAVKDQVLILQGKLKQPHVLVTSHFPSMYRMNGTLPVADDASENYDMACSDVTCILTANVRTGAWGLGASEDFKLRVWVAKPSIALEWRELPGSPFAVHHAYNAGQLFPLNSTHFIRFGQSCHQGFCGSIKAMAIRPLSRMRQIENDTGARYSETEILRLDGLNVLDPIVAPGGIPLKYASVIRLPSTGQYLLMGSTADKSLKTKSPFLAVLDVCVPIIYCISIFTVLYLIYRSRHVLVKGSIVRAKKKQKSLSFSLWDSSEFSKSISKGRLYTDKIYCRNYFWHLSPSVRRAMISVLLAVALLFPPLFARYCESIRPFLETPRAYPVSGQYSQYSVMTMTYTPRLKLLYKFVKHYSACPSAGEIVIILNGNSTYSNPQILSKISRIPVRFRKEEENSMNNRYKPDSLIHRRAVLSMDDDLLIPCKDIEIAFTEWRKETRSIVGWFPRLAEENPSPKHGMESVVYRGEPHTIDTGMYNLILTGAAFLDSRIAFPLYWSRKFDLLRDYVDKVRNCDDILMNFVMAGVSEDAHSVRYLRASRILDYSRSTGVGISHKEENFVSQASTCLNLFIKTVGNPLKRRHFEWDKLHKKPHCSVHRSVLFCEYSH